MSSLPTPSGYAVTDDYFGVVSHQKDLRLVTLTLPWPRVVKMVVTPDPHTKSDYNRPLTVNHAKRFGQYLDLAEDPFTPPLTLFTDPDYVELSMLDDIDPSLAKFGFHMVKLNRDAIVHILDGQHRIYGVMLQGDDYDKQLDKAKQTLIRAKKTDSPKEVITSQEAQVKKLKEKIKRLDSMEVTVQLLLTAEGDLAKSIFADVADNAKGISGSQRADFSDRSVFNRVARQISLNGLEGMVDHVKDRMSTNNPHWISLKDVVNVVQALEYPIGKRWTIKREAELVHRELAIESMAQDYFDGIFEAFPDLASVKDGELAAPELRPGGGKVSLLGSATMIRAMASAYRRLRKGEKDEKTGNWVEKSLKHRQIVDIWSNKLPSMQAGHIPDDSGDPDKAKPLLDKRWIDVGVFEYPYVAPRARNKDLNTLVEAITDMTRSA